MELEIETRDRSFYMFIVKEESHRKPINQSELQKKLLLPIWEIGLKLLNVKES